ncbi:MAG TPA: DUF3053 family protein, partial [Propylenella sp.]|nr:DUF3053 family protein [Propylenella sp.]
MAARRGGFGLTWVVIAALALAGCGASDAEQKAAFSEFLQTRVLDKTGIHVPQLTDEERESFGQYAEHYAI